MTPPKPRLVVSPGRPASSPLKPRKPREPKTVHRERMKRTIYRPWPASRLFLAEHHELVDREWELTKLLNLVQSELNLIKQRTNK